MGEKPMTEFFMEEPTAPEGEEEKVETPQGGETEAPKEEEPEAGEEKE